MKKEEKRLYSKIVEATAFCKLDECAVCDEGKSSIVFLPNSLQDRCIKVYRRDTPSELFHSELKAYESFDKLGIKNVPRLIAWNENPAYLVLTRMGPTVNKIWSLRRPSLFEIEKVSTSIGMFAAKIFTASMLTHGDIDFGNMTLEDNGEVGFLDFSMVNRDDPHMSFVKIMARRPNVVKNAIRVFSEITDYSISSEKVSEYARYIVKRCYFGKEQKNMVSNINLNFEDLCSPSHPKDLRLRHELLKTIDI